MPRFSPSRALKRELVSVVSIFLVATCSGMVYFASWGQTADILQASFGPSVMLACDRGFVNPQASAIPELAEFLRPDLHRNGPPVIDTFACELLPEDIPTVPFTGIHKRTWHMFWIAGWIWRVFGVAWSSLTPLYGVLFGLSAAAAYGLFRLVLNPPIALFCGALFLISPIQFHYLPRLRDFAKAPFMLVALYCLLLLVLYPKGNKRALWTGALAGACIGMATGFRAEAVMYLVVFLPAVILFYPGWRWPTWVPRAVAMAAFLVCFLLAGWPVLMKFQTYGERTHPFLMGFAEIYDGRLGVENDTYQVAHRFLDAEALAQMNAHNLYLDAEAKPIIYETPGYEAVGDDYFFRNLLWKFPGDLATRTYASGLRILDELRPSPNVFMPRGITHRFLEPLYAGRSWLMDTLFSRTRYVALALLLVLGALSPRLGFMVLYLFFCLAGMASVQFATRHYFHLEWIPLLLGGALIQILWLALRGLGREKRSQFRAQYLTRTWMVTHGKSGVLFALATTLLVLVPWQALRWHQDRQLTHLVTALEEASTKAVWPTVAGFRAGQVLLNCKPITLDGGLPDVGPEGFFQVDMLVVEVKRGSEAFVLSFDYAADHPERNLSWAVEIAPQAGTEETIRYYAPVYNAVWPDTPDNDSWDDVGVAWTRFEGVRVAEKDLPQIVAMERLEVAPGYSPLITLAVAPDWASRPLYQQFVR